MQDVHGPRSRNRDRRSPLAHVRPLKDAHPSWIGYIEASHANKILAKNGYQPVCGELPNASMTSSIPTVPSQFYPEEPGRVLPLDPNGIYVTWYGVDVDAIDFALLTYKAFRHDPEADQAPLLIKMCPYLADWFPTLFEWFTECHPEQVDFFYAPLGDGPPPKGPPTTVHCKHYVENSNGAFGSHMAMESPSRAVRVEGPVMPQS